MCIGERKRRGVWRVSTMAVVSTLALSCTPTPETPASSTTTTTTPSATTTSTTSTTSSTTTTTTLPTSPPDPDHLVDDDLRTPELIRLLADLDGDGRLDAVTRGDASSTNTTRIALQSEDGFGAGTTWTGPTYVSTFVRVDVDGDPRDDVLEYVPRICVPTPHVPVCAATETEQLRVFRGNGAAAPVLTADIRVTVPRDAQLVDAQVIDLDGDAVGDLLYGITSDSSLRVRPGVGDGTFGEERLLPAIDRPARITVTDVDGDDRPDLMVGGQGATTGSPFGPARLAVLLAAGGGEFELPDVMELPNGTEPSHVAAADLDGDGDLDLVGFWDDPVYLSQAFALVVVEGLGHGEFAAPVSTPAPGAMGRVQAADMDGDGHVDLVGVHRGEPNANRVPRALTVYPGRGDLGFDAPVGVASADHPAPPVLADLDGDGHLDAVTTSQWSGTAAVHMGGPGGLGEATWWSIGGRTAEPLLLDVDGDGVLDLTAGSQRFVLPGTGDGTFVGRRAVPTGVAPGDLEVADLDADGRADVLVADRREGNSHGSMTGTLNLHLTDASGPGPVSPLLAKGTAMGAVASGDLDGDGIVDLVMSSAWWNSSGNTETGLVTRLGRGDGTFAEAQVHPSTFTRGRITLGDLDGDGHLDVVTSEGTVSPSATTVSVFLGQGGGTLGARTDLATGSGPFDVLLADLDGDGDLDLIVGNVVARTISVLLGHGDGTFAPKVDLSSTHERLALGDMDGDGVLDLVHTANGGSFGVRRGVGDGTFEATVGRGSGVSGPAGGLVLVDLDLDGHLDVAATNRDQQTLMVHLGSGGGVFEPARVFGAGSAPVDLGTGDVDGDGLADLVVLHSGNDTSGEARASFSVMRTLPG